MPVSLPSGLTDAQARAIQAAIRAAPDPQWHDGMLRNISARLDGAGPWDDATINRAILSVFADLGVDGPFLPT